MFDTLIAGRTPSYEGEARWGAQIHLSVRVFPCAEPPQADLVTSVRGVVFNGVGEDRHLTDRPPPGRSPTVVAAPPSQP